MKKATRRRYNTIKNDNLTIVFNYLNICFVTYFGLEMICERSVNGNASQISWKTVQSIRSTNREQTVAETGNDMWDVVVAIVSVASVESSFNSWMSIRDSYYKWLTYELYSCRYEFCCPRAQARKHSYFRQYKGKYWSAGISSFPSQCEFFSHEYDVFLTLIRAFLKQTSHWSEERLTQMTAKLIPSSRTLNNVHVQHEKMSEWKNK